MLFAGSLMLCASASCISHQASYKELTKLLIKHNDLLETFCRSGCLCVTGQA